MQEEMYFAFEQYLGNEMNLEEKAAFENKLLEDTYWKENFELYQQTHQFLKNKFSSKTVAFKQNLKLIALENQSNKNSLKIIPMYSKWFAVAATVVLFCSIWFFMQSNEPNYIEYNQHEKAYFTERSEGVAVLKEAQDAFNAKAYESAVGYFEQIPHANRNEEINLYHAIALLETNKFEQAEALLQTIKSGNSVYKEKAIWYLGLSKLKQKDYTSCKQLLEGLPESADDYSKAQEILEKL
ncbi:tetratricopeptide repeat protein [Flavobacterium sp. NRK F7]|uniref:tetratricopeptide repeat protein n=1 Tax=Flavobacterium sp. NRK F7 TaxID=2954930 RepID=UPI00209156DE|nr:tetratricopeptide repeat protein [Flavobacterium sp. NRK F7]MCO6161987.1 tetratricopeptide repeat protein [Flavobacterium sp. NRK F7]